MLHADYAIVFEGALRPELAAAFAPAVVEVGDGTTTVRAAHLDQAALLGLLEHGRHLGLDLLQVQALAPGGSTFTPTG
jgi:hypothetical protein